MSRRSSHVLRCFKFNRKIPEVLSSDRKLMRQIEETTKLKLIIATIALLIIMITPAVVPHVSAQSTSFSFNLITPNVSKAVADIMIQGIFVAKDSTTRLTGSGTFDSSTNAVSGGGSVTGFSPTGSVDVRGTWTVTDLVSFNHYTGPMGNPGHQGGLLMVKASFTITFTFNGATKTFDGIPVQISCLINAPAMAPGEGTTIPGIFDQAVSGFTLFHENS